MAPVVHLIMEKEQFSSSPNTSHFHEFYEDHQMYVHRCFFPHCHHHNHQNNQGTQLKSTSKVVNPTRDVETPSEGWTEKLVTRGFTEGVTQDYRRSVIAYIVDNLSSKEILQTSDARERLQKTVAALELNVYETNCHQKEYLKSLARKLSTVYEHLKRESNTCILLGQTPPANTSSQQHTNTDLTDKIKTDKIQTDKTDKIQNNSIPNTEDNTSQHNFDNQSNVPEKSELTAKLGRTEGVESGINIKNVQSISNNKVLKEENL